IKEQLQQLEMMEKQVGLTLGDVKRATGVMFDPNGRTGYFAIISTTKPYDKAKILALLPPRLQEKQHQGKTYHADPAVAIYFHHDRLIVIGDGRGIERLLDYMAQPNSTGPLSESLKLAADHDLVVGANPPADKVN